MRTSISALKLFKACRRAYQLKYVEGLEPVQTPEALETGRNYHKKIEDVCNGCLDTSDLSRESAMALAYQKYIQPQFHVKTVEEWVEYDLGDGNTLVGRIDARTENNALVEHKTTSQDIGEEYEYDLQWDEQLLAYMLMTGARQMYYTIIKKPTIRQKKNETEQEFFDRMVSWYDEDTESKIRVLFVFRTDDEVEAFRRELQETVSELANVKAYYKNTAYCNKFGRRCEYAPVCLYYDPDQEYVEFTRREKKNAVDETERTEF